MTAPLACDTGAIAPEDRARHRELTRYIVAEAASDISETPQGLVLRFPAEEFNAVAEFVGYERLCCPFVDFTFRVAAAQQGVQLELTGPEGVTEFLRAELGLGQVTGSSSPSPSL